MKQFISIILLLSIMGLNSVNAQNMPTPIRSYPLGSLGAKEVINKKNGTIHGTINKYKDRFGDANGASIFGESSLIETPNFFQYSTYINGFTISFWTFIDKSISKLSGVKPWLDSDKTYQAFYARSGSVSIGNIMLGFERRRDRALINRYTSYHGQNKKDWKIWLWDPVNFTNKIGWYHIVLVYEKAKMTTYMTYPNGQIESNTHYFRIQNLSSASLWGIGGFLGNSFKYMDDFKVFDTALPYNQVRQLYSQESPPNGMYNIRLGDNQKVYMHTVKNSYSGATPLEILDYNSKNTATFRWVFEPVSGKPNIYRIRMAYTSTTNYVHLIKNRTSSATRVETLDYQPKNAPYFEWKIVPASTYGKFYIISNADQSKYLNPVSQSTASATRLEILDFKPNIASKYEWRLDLIKTNYELNKSYFKDNVAYEPVYRDNPVLSLQPVLPATGTSARVQISREDEVSALSFWYFKKDIDDSYRVYNSAILDKSINPVDQNTNINTGVEILKYTAGDRVENRYFRWVMERPNPFGRGYKPTLSLNQTVAIGASKPQIGQHLKLLDVNKTNVEWQLFENNDFTSANKQIYHIKPGFYRVRSVHNNKYLTTSDYNYTRATKVVLKNYNLYNYTTYSWKLEYEKDANGDDIRDGSYIVKLYGSNQCLHTVNDNLSDATKLEILPLNKTHITTFKWRISPVLNDPNANEQYTVSLGGDSNMNMHVTSESMDENTSIEILPYNKKNKNSFRWVFEPAILDDTPLDDGLYRLTLREDPTKFLHVKNRSITDGAKVEIYPFTGSAEINWYTWQFTKNDDNTYFIRFGPSSKYLRPTNNSTSRATRLEIVSLDEKNIHSFKWIVTKVEFDETYFIRLLPAPSQFMHIQKNSTVKSTPVEILPYNSSFSDAYEWIPIK